MGNLLSLVRILMPALCAVAQFATAAMQDGHALPEPYLAWEKSYLKESPELQRAMDYMVATTARQMKDPSQDILHNRVCAALAFEMARKLRGEDRKLAIVTGLLHNVSKEEMPLVLTDAEVRARAHRLIVLLRDGGYFKRAPQFWRDSNVFDNPLLGANRALVHHITGALMAGAAMQEIGGYSPAAIARVQAAVAEHSTGYWYFRQSADDILRRKDAWQLVFPEPDSEISRIAHDADLISQFEVQSVIPQGSKWRVIAAKRWGAKGPVEEAHIVYYVFLRLYEEARTDAGRGLARVEWEKIRPELVKLMGLQPGEDPLKKFGTPKVFQRD